MPRKNEIPSKPRFGFVSDMAQTFLLEQGCDSFPINPFELLKHMTDRVEVLTWHEANEQFHTSDAFHLKQIKAEARTIRRRDHDSYYVVYDDTVSSWFRLVWTMTHELGHVVLGHLVEFDKTSLERGGITKKEYGVLEIEAHFFAAEVLMPTCIVNALPNCSSEKLSLVFGVSKAAADKKVKRLNAVDYPRGGKYDETLKRNFTLFMNTRLEDAMNRSIQLIWLEPWSKPYQKLCRKCPYCLSYITNADAKYCPMCGEKLQQRQVLKGKSVQEIMAMHFERQRLIEADGIKHSRVPFKAVRFGNEGEASIKAAICPVCMNQDIPNSASFCRICGHPVRNYCKAEGKQLNLESRYCPDCGSKTLMTDFYERDDERKQRIQDCTNQPDYDEDWMPYPYWEYFRMRILYHSQVSQEAKAAILYSNAYVDDEDMLHVYADTLRGVATFDRDRTELLERLRRIDKKTKIQGLEVHLYR